MWHPLLSTLFPLLGHWPNLLLCATISALLFLIFPSPITSHFKSILSYSFVTFHSTEGKLELDEIPNNSFFLIEESVINFWESLLLCCCFLTFDFLYKSRDFQEFSCSGYRVSAFSHKSIKLLNRFNPNRAEGPWFFGEWSRKTLQVISIWGSLSCRSYLSLSLKK